jgi:hypothetical protein
VLSYRERIPPSPPEMPQLGGARGLRPLHACGPAARPHRLGHALATGLRPRRARVPVRRSLGGHCPDHRASRRHRDLGLGRPAIPATASRESPKSGRP